MLPRTFTLASCKPDGHSIFVLACFAWEIKQNFVVETLSSSGSKMIPFILASRREGRGQINLSGDPQSMTST